jgi:hypothetical protein
VLSGHLGISERVAGSLDSQERVEQVVLTKSVGTAYVMNLMSATQNGGGVDMARLNADAIAAQRGNRAARSRLFAAIRRSRPLALTSIPRVTAGMPCRRLAAEGRPQRRPARSGLRARSRDPGPEPPLTARQPQAARVVVRAPRGWSVRCMLAGALSLLGARFAAAGWRWL